MTTRDNDDVAVDPVSGKPLHEFVVPPVRIGVAPDEQEPVDGTTSLVDTDEDQGRPPRIGAPGTMAVLNISRDEIKTREGRQRIIDMVREHRRRARQEDD